MCEIHAKQLRKPRQPVSDVRIVKEAPESDGRTIKTENEPKTPAIASTKPGESVSPELTRAFSESNPVRATTDATAKLPIHELTFGNSTKAMVDEAIWNLASGNLQAYKRALELGKSAAEAAEAAGGQLAVIHRKIADYTLKLEEALTKAKGAISTRGAVDEPLERAMLEIIGNNAMSEPEKDAAVQQLGAIQEWAKQGFQGEISPLQANRILLAIGERVNWGRAADISEQCKSAYGMLYKNLQTAIRAAAPAAQHLHERLTNLYAAKSDLEVL